MKKFAQRHSVALVALSSVLLCAVIVLGVYVWCDISADGERDESLERLYETEMYSAAESLSRSLGEGELTVAYHYSKSAEEYAKRAGESEEAALFCDIADCLRRNELPDEELTSALGELLRHGELPVREELGAVSGTAHGEYEPEFISEHRRQAARDTVGLLFGVGDVLHLAERCADGRLIFTCKNAYAEIDAKTGIPISASLSLADGEGSITPNEAVSRAAEYLSAFYPLSDVYTSAVLSAELDMPSGAYIVKFRTAAGYVSASVRMDSGRVVRLSVISEAE